MLGGASKIVVPIFFYIAMFVAVYFAFFRDKFISLLLLLPLCALGNIRMKLAAFPLGKDYVDIILAALIISIFLQRQLKIRTQSSPIIVAYMLMLLFSAFIVSDMQGGFGYQKNLPNFKNYILMPIIYFVVYCIVNHPRHIKHIVMLAALVFLAADRTTYGEYGFGLHHTFVAEQRPGGIFGAEGLGANHLGAYMSQYTMILVGICAVQVWDWRSSFLVISIAGNLYSLLFSFSRGAWFGGIVGFMFMSLVKGKRLLPLFLLFALFWQNLVPESVLQRLEMTSSPIDADFAQSNELDRSSERRLELWRHAYELFLQSPLVGHGLYSFSYYDGQLWVSTHNQYMAFLAETGLIGFVIFLGLFVYAFRSGWVLFRKGKDKFLQGLGLGFCGCVLACMVNNIFGDRWTQFSLMSLYWAFWALVDRASSLPEEAYEKEDEESVQATDTADSAVSTRPA